MESKFFIGIISHKGSTKRKQQLDIWRAANIPEIEYYYFIGDPTIESDYIVDESEKTVYLKVPDNYESLPLKTKGIIKFANDNYSGKISGIFKTDDDIEIDPGKIYSMLELNKELDYYGIEVNVEKYYESLYHSGKCESDYWNSTRVVVPESRYCAGGGYYIKASLLSDVIEKSYIYDNIIFEDVATGMIMNRSGIFPVNINVKENGLNW